MRTGTLIALVTLAGFAPTVGGTQTAPQVDELLERGRAATERPSDSREAKRLFDDALRLVEHHHGGEHRAVGELALEVGEILLAKRWLARDSRRYLARAHDILGRAPDGDLARGRASFHFGRFHYSRQQHRVAVRLLDEALATFVAGGHDEHAMRTHALLVDVNDRLGRTNEASRHARAVGAMVAWRDDADPQPLFVVQPQYPRGAAAYGEEGWVRVRFRIAPDGSVLDPQVDAHEGSASFIRPTLRAVERWRFAPKIVDGDPVEAEAGYTVEFSRAEPPPFF